jgi:hypothetical protein
MANEKNRGPFEQIGETVGGTVGKAMGRANDMAMSAAGSVLGSAMSMLGDWWSSAEADRATNSFGDREDEACREHFTSRRSRSGSSSASASASSTPSDYESYRPVYQFGFVAGQNPEYQAKPFDRVESDLERAWEAVGRDRFGEWPEVRDQVSFGYTYRDGGAPNPS